MADSPARDATITLGRQGQRPPTGKKWKERLESLVEAGRFAAGGRFKRRVTSAHEWGVEPDKFTISLGRLVDQIELTGVIVSVACGRRKHSIRPSHFAKRLPDDHGWKGVQIRYRPAKTILVSGHMRARLTLRN